MDRYVSEIINVLQECPLYLSYPRHTECTDYYLKAKQAVAKDKDYEQAAYFFYLTIKHKSVKSLSAIKDYASLLHQRSLTYKGIELLERSIGYLKKQDLGPMRNLIKNLMKQVENPSGNHLNKHILLRCLPRDINKEGVLKLFKNPSRIQSIEFYTDCTLRNKCKTNIFDFCVVGFETYSAGKKTYQTFCQQSCPDIEMIWVNVNKNLRSKIQLNRASLINQCQILKDITNDYQGQGFNKQNSNSSTIQTNHSEKSIDRFVYERVINTYKLLNSYKGFYDRMNQRSTRLICR